MIYITNRIVISRSSKPSCLYNAIAPLFVCQTFSLHARGSSPPEAVQARLEESLRYSLPSVFRPDVEVCHVAQPVRDLKGRPDLILEQEVSDKLVAVGGNQDLAGVLFHQLRDELLLLSDVSLVSGYRLIHCQRIVHELLPEPYELFHFVSSERTNLHLVDF